MRRICFVLLQITFLSAIYGQSTGDTIKTHTLRPVIIDGSKQVRDIRRLDDIQGTYNFSGKKSEVVILSGQNNGLAEKYCRQLFAKIPGIFVYDMDGTGNQVNISSRGLDPHRGWEFNIRKDGVITNTDMYGYPASHYNVPMEAVERIELVRGTSSQQYGGQFGGMLNYVTKAPSSQKLGFESINTVGSYGLLSTFNSLSGTLGKLRYAVWMNKKSLEGYRHYNDSKYNAESVALYYDINESMTLKAEFTHSNYVIHLAGALNDRQFADDPRQATRTRNYYNPDIYIPSFTFDWKIGERTKLKLVSNAILGDRNSVMFDKPANIADTIVTATGQYNHRQVDIDNYHSFMNEVRMLHEYRFLSNKNVLTAGIQTINNDLHRRQQGVGSTGSDYDLSLSKPGWGRDLHFITNNVAVFMENKWALTERFSINTSARMEVGKSRLEGVISNYPNEELPNTIEHKFPLLGASMQYNFIQSNIYGGWSQAYRPVVLKDIVPGSVYEKADKNLKDAFGYNAELGYRGQSEWLTWDVTAFYLLYQNRLGTVALNDQNGQLTIFRTNIGDSHTKGVEAFVQGDWTLGKASTISVYNATSWMDARYKDATVRTGNENISVDGNQVESAPKIISRSGVTYKYSRWTACVKYSYTAESFADALNTKIPNASGAVGLVPAYSIVDVNMSVRFNEHLKLQVNANNLFDKSYFAKRPQFYPGPGIWPSDGRTFSATIAIKLY
ncbi:MAG: TonB-dependent receptor [Saprospiraceae bacterium]|nr:TonB-dependent receptor [Saprospiraceae bacterium]